MKLKYQVKHNDKLLPVGDYKSGTLPKAIEDDLKAKGYFEVGGEDSTHQVDPSDLNVKGIQKLKTVKAVVSAMETLDDDQLLELLELENASKKPRKGVQDAISDRLEAE